MVSFFDSHKGGCRCSPVESQATNSASGCNGTRTVQTRRTAPDEAPQTCRTVPHSADLGIPELSLDGGFQWAEFRKPPDVLNSSTHCDDGPEFSTTSIGSRISAMPQIWLCRFAHLRSQSRPLSKPQRRRIPLQPLCWLLTSHSLASNTLRSSTTSTSCNQATTSHPLHPANDMCIDHDHHRAV